MEGKEIPDADSTENKKQYEEEEARARNAEEAYINENKVRERVNRLESILKYRYRHRHSHLVKLRAYWELRKISREINYDEDMIGKVWPLMFNYEQDILKIATKVKRAAMTTAAVAGLVGIALLMKEGCRDYKTLRENNPPEIKKSESMKADSPRIEYENNRIRYI